MDWMQAFEASKASAKPPRSDTVPAALLAPNAIMTVVQNQVALQASSSPLLGTLPRDVSRFPNTTTMACLISVMLRYVHEESMKQLPPLNGDDDGAHDRDSPTSGGKVVSPPSGTTPSGTPPQNTSAALPSSNTSSSSWSMPWIMSALNGATTGTGGGSGGSGTDVYYNSGDAMVSHGNTNAIVVWPTGLELEAGTAQLNGYTGELQSRQRELHKLFDNVPRNELVLEGECPVDEKKKLSM